MVLASTAITIIGLGGGFSTAITSLVLSKKLGNRDVSKKEILIAMFVVGAGSAAAVMLLKSRKN